jgi:hypothetical protein
MTPENPQAVFRNQLASLRRMIADSIVGRASSDVSDGFAIYRRLLEHLLSRFDELEKKSGSRPSTHVLSIGEYSGQELTWLVDDCRYFLRRAIAIDDLDVTYEVVGGIFGLGATCLRMGDGAAFASFDDLLAYAWSSTNA